MARLPASLCKLRVRPVEAPAALPPGAQHGSHRSTSSRSSGRQHRLQLGHLTACTQLDMMVSEETQLHPQRPDGSGDVLPPNLRHLRGNFVGADVLKRLPHLTFLHGPHSAERLVEFAHAGMTQLTHVALMLYGDVQEWAQVEFAEHQGRDGTFGLRKAVCALRDAGIARVVRSVEVDSLGGDSDVSLVPAVVAELQRLPALACLRLVVVPVDPPSLLTLTQLTELDLLNVHFDNAELKALPGVLAQLPNLRKVLMSKPTAAAAADELSNSLTSLTGLSVELLSWP